jgi:type I restriction enzyme S subunit
VSDSAEVSDHRTPWDLPATWTWTTMGTVADVIGGGTPSTSDPTNYEDGDIAWITPADLSGHRGKLIERGARNITRKGLERSSARLMPAGTVLFSSRAPIGYVTIASGPVSTNQGFKSFVLPSGLESGYVYYYLKRAKDIATALAGGTTFLEISGAKAGQIPLPLAPFAEQHRIVDEVEKHATRLDASVAALERARANLKRYRAAVLAAACEGRLVPTEADLARRVGRDCGLATKARVPLHEGPPEGWSMATLSDICSKIQDGTHFSPKDQTDQGEYRYLTAKNVRLRGLELSDVTYLSEREHRKIYERCDPQKGDVLLVKDGVNTGDAALNTLDEEFSLLSSVCILRPDAPVLSGAYLRYYLVSPVGRRLLTANMSGTAIRRIVLRRIKQVAIAFPPLAEQHRIVAEVERRLSVVDELETVVDRSLKRAERLRQSILKHAFEGKLVAQDPNDEPASVLLERIRAERAAQEHARNSRRGLRTSSRRRMRRTPVPLADYRTGGPNARE